MKKMLLVLFTVIICTAGYSQYNWIQKASYPGPARWGAISFGVGNKGYMGTGLPSDFTYDDGTDFWQYDPATNSWARMASFPGGARREATTFVIGDTGYVAVGASGEDVVNQLWGYDATNNVWTRKADFPGAARWYAAGFAVNGKGYVGTGSDGAGGSFADWWEYDPTTDTWTQKADVPGGARNSAFALSIGDKGYLGGGSTGTNDFWEYDPMTDTWTKKANVGGSAKYSSIAFSLGDVGYVGAQFDNEFWEYDPATDQWNREIDFAGPARYDGTGFSTATAGYLGTGLSGGNFTGDFWSFSSCTPAGDPSVFGDNVWNVYGWNIGGASIDSNTWNVNYAGYYVEPLVSFDTKDRWSDASSPSSASGWQGCVLNPDNHSWSAKRKGFPCGLYQVNIPMHDDAAQLFVNGTKVWEHNGCCDAHTKVWIGELGADTTLEFRVTEGGGSSGGNIQVVAATPTIIANGLTDICKGNFVTLSCDVQYGNQWYKDDVPIDGATQQTYAATEAGSYVDKINIAGCGSFASQAINVTVSTTAAPGDTAVFGNNTWNVYAFNSGDGTLTGTKWQDNYSGYYTNGSISFDTRTDWDASLSPSSASNYQGCPIVTDNHSWTAKRQGFPCGDYVINIIGHDDAAQLFVDGAKAWEENGANGNSEQAWQGHLDENSKIEFRGTDAGGGSYGALDIAEIKPTITPGNITTFCPGYSITLTADSSSGGYLWSTGETTQTITVSQSGNYTVKELNSCGVQVESLPVTVTVQPLAKPVLTTNYGFETCASSYADYSDFYVSNLDYNNTYSVNSDSVVNYGYGYFTTPYAGTYTITAKDVLGCTSDTSVVVTEAPGNPDDFGNNVWNVYAFDNAAGQGYNTPWTHYVHDDYGYGIGYFNAYYGYYADTALSFNTQNNWSPDGVPADAPNFQGCGMPDSYGSLFSWSAKRKGFPCGHYQINVLNHDDEAELWIDGVKVWNEEGATGTARDNVWQGILGTNSTVIFRVNNSGSGQSFGAINLILTDNNVVTKPTITPNGYIDICANSSVQLTSSAPSGNLWNTGATTKSIVVNTTGNYYVSVTGSEGCSAQSDVVSVTTHALSTYYRDADGDGYGNPNISVQGCSAPAGYVANNNDCNDKNASIHPKVYYHDADGDSYGSSVDSIVACPRPAGYVNNKRDKDDNNPTVYPGAPELCDGVDNNQNGKIDEGCILISIADTSVMEQPNTQRIMKFFVTLNQKSTQPVTVNYTTQDGTATAGSDYMAQSGVLTFAPGVKRVILNITVYGDKIQEPDETFNILLSSPVNAGINDGIAVGTIINYNVAAFASSGEEKSISAGDKSFSIAPNPASSAIHISLTSYTGKVTIRLSDEQGKILQEKRMDASMTKVNQTTLDVSHYANGVYFITVFDDKGNNATQKLVIQR